MPIFFLSGAFPLKSSKKWVGSASYPQEAGLKLPLLEVSRDPPSTWEAPEVATPARQAWCPRGPGAGSPGGGVPEPRSRSSRVQRLEKQVLRRHANSLSR